MSRTTLRELNGFDQKPAKLADATLLLIDFQNTYTQGVMELDGWEESLDAAAQLLARAREAGTRIVHVINDGGEGTPYDIRAEIGGIHPKVAPLDGEPVVVKQVPNAFVGTDLDTHLKEGQDVVIAGWMTHMCVAFTAQGAFLNGNRPTVVAEATATRSLPITGTGTDVDARQVHDSALATIADLYGVVVATQKEIV
ncbi:isochorismatase family protein [Streptomyces venezuelae]|uniref:isochorismatase family protein n=1 Tax=Streptomyces venezuelae TaxID=54571 RepID=UPI00379B365E